MATLRTGDAGFDTTRLNLGEYADLQVQLTALRATELNADFRRVGQPERTVRLRGNFALGGNRGVQPFGEVSQISESRDGQVLFELSDVSIPLAALLREPVFPGAPRSPADPFLLSRTLAGNDLVQGSSGNDVLQAFAGNNTIQGSGGIDTAVIAAARSATLSFRWRDDAVVLRQAARQADQLSSIEFVRFADREYAAFELPELRPLDYVASYSDLAQTFGTDEGAAWRHFANQGLLEGRSISFNALNYLASYRDLAQAFGTDANAGARHYLASGRAEGRAVSFDGLRYIASYGDLIQVLPHTIDAGAMHFIASGAAEGRTITFDPLRYLASNLDVARAFSADEMRGLDHWINKGYSENRSATAFDPAQYLARYADLRAAFGTDQRAATLHWIGTGAAEGRIA